MKNEELLKVIDKSIEKHVEVLRLLDEGQEGEAEDICGGSCSFCAEFYCKWNKNDFGYKERDECPLIERGICGTHGSAWDDAYMAMNDLERDARAFECHLLEKLQEFKEEVEEDI